MSESFGADDRPRNAEMARKVVDDIRSEHGVLDATDEVELRKNSPEWRERHIRNAEKRQRDYARFTKIVADQLYSSKFRCIPEILQNADDAEYSKTNLPSLTFRIRPSEIIIDSNEDGFTYANVKSICSTGQSSKTDNADSTGEKGLGFKSVFGIARRVHIQSGFWSFRFEHRRNQDGIGMVTPIWTEPATESVPKGIGTRFRLKYAEKNDKFLRSVVNEFEQLPDTTIFALRKLKKLNIAFEDVLGRNYMVSFEKRGDFNQSEIRLLSRISGQSDRHQDAETRIRVFRTPIPDPPLDTSSDDSSDDFSDDLSSNKARDVVVGFQVDPDSGEPIIPDHGQQVFAFLPVGRLPQLPFIIHADFTLAANREAIPEIEWNQRLRDGVAEAFTDAVTEFCEDVDDPLVYCWMRYLPRNRIEGFWNNLESLIQESLWDRDILFSGDGNLKRLSDLRVLPKNFEHDNEPLFPDTIDDIYLAAQYEESDIEILKELGLDNLSEAEMVERIERDVLDNPTTLLGGRYRKEDWHSSFAMLAADLLYNNADAWNRVAKLPIIPLKNGDWVSPNSFHRNRVYLPYLIDEEPVKIEIPDNLGLRKLHPESCKDSETSSFYAAIGISSCKQNLIIDKILEFHKNRAFNGRLRDAVAHLEILFWYYDTLPSGAVSRSIFVRDRSMTWIRASRSFFRSAELYSAEKLLEHTSPKDFSGFGFLHDDYMESKVQYSIKGDTTWKGFLESIGVRYYPDLFNRKSDPATLNPVLELVVRDNPGKFIPNLQAHWTESYVHQFGKLRDRLKEIPILCNNGEMEPLRKTLIPTHDLLTKSDELRLQSDLPFIKLPDDAVLKGEDKWKFLREFGVICEPDLNFYFMVLDVLGEVGTTQPSAQDLIETLKNAYTRVYLGIATISKFGDGAKLKKKFTKTSCIFIPSSSPKWCIPDQCVWSGPSVLHETHVLKSIYQENSDLEKLFVTLLNVGNATFEHVIQDLCSLRKSYPDSLPEVIAERMSQYYSVLSEMMTSEDSIQKTRDSFESHGLVYALGRWCKPSSSIWNCSVELSGRTPIEQSYPALRNFFVKKLGVNVMSASVLTQELISASKSASKSPGLMKALLVALGQVLSTDPHDRVTKEQIEDLKMTPFLPVRKAGNHFFQGVSGELFINDHERYGNAFFDKINLVDFTCADLTTLHSLFSLLDLESRYLSKHVETTTVVKQSVKNDQLTDHLRQRAYPLSCCADFYRSAKYFNKSTKIHSLLLNAEVLVCEDMRTNLIVKTESGKVKVKSDRALVKIEVKEHSLTVSVPGDGPALYSCYRTELPSKLVQILGIETSRAEKPLYRILNCEDWELDEIMDHEDIPHRPWFEKPPPSKEAPATRQSVNQGTDLVDDLLGRTNVGEASNSDENTYLGTNVEQGSEVEDIHENIVVTSRFERSSQRVLPTVERRIRQSISYSGTTLQRVALETAYRRLLHSVVRQARRLPDSRSAGEVTLSLAELNESLNDIASSTTLLEYFGLSNGSGHATSFEENARIGAAGELFVLERLRALAFPGFGLDNWQSRIRAYVNVHPDYTGLTNWPGPETADFVYRDGSGRFERWLRRTSKHPFPALPQDGEIKYLIEVKTTTGPCKTPFFMSQNQYRLMKKHRLANDDDDGATSRTVYVIMRVYNLLLSNVTVELYVDPWRLRDTVLEFVADPWKVVPV